LAALGGRRWLEPLGDAPNDKLRQLREAVFMSAGLTRVLFVNRYFFPDHSATSQLATDLAADLAARGFEVVAITSHQRYDDPSGRLAPEEMHAHIRIRRVRTTSFGRKKLIGRALDYLSFYLAASFALWRESRRGAVVIAMTDPPLLGVPALVIAQLRGAHCVNWLQDVFPEVAERLCVLRSRGLAGAFRLLRNWSLRHSATTVVIGDKMAALVAPLCRLPPVVIPNWALEESDGANSSVVSGEVAASNPLRAAWGLRDAFVVGYSGNMGRAHRLDELIDAASALRSESRLRFVLIGDGAQRAALEARVQDLALENVMFQPYQPRERLRESLSLPDIHIVSLDERLEGLIVPSKFVGVLAMGRPVVWIGSADGEVGSLVRMFGCGVIVPPGDPGVLTRVLRELSDDHENGGVRLHSMANQAHLLWRKRFKRRDALNAWAMMIKHCAAEKR
jgi:glycosyltransferase involved in cell wall biosynthesis